MTLTRSYWSKLHLAFAVCLLAFASQIPLFGAAAPAWELKDLNGNAVKLSDFKGKVVILDFWATWCPPCRAEIPHFVELQDKYGKQGLVIVGISLDEGGPGVVSSFVKANKINYPIVMGNLDIAQQPQESSHDILRKTCPHGLLEQTVLPHRNSHLLVHAAFQLRSRKPR
jgi:thiol-disulfide isomerase/thioredoxin